jgi:hypothetical protein
MVCQYIRIKWAEELNNLIIILLGAGISQSVLRLATVWTAGVRFYVAARDCSLLQIVQTGSGANPASYTKSIEGSFVGVKPSGREADNLLPSRKRMIKIYAQSPTYLHHAGVN